MQNENAGLFAQNLRELNQALALLSMGQMLHIYEAGVREVFLVTVIPN